MPREHQKRGRRAEKQQRERGHDEEPAHKRQRLENEQESSMDGMTFTGELGDDYIEFQVPPDKQFYGLLDEEEQEYYTNVNNKITANDFDGDEDRDLFVEAVYRESQGKEIKLASSQSCSRHLERLIQISKPSQLQTLFAAFLQDIIYLAQHRFGSHCCESLFRRAALFVKKDGKFEDHESIESQFLQAATLLKDNVAYLLTERFASHTLRVLFLVLSGESLEDPSLKAVIASEKKEKLESSVHDQLTSPNAQRQIPKAFHSALTDFISTAASKMDMVYLRSLATHPIGSPALQMLLQFELNSGEKSNRLSDMTLLKKLLPDENFDAESESGKFLSGLVYDPTGSHLIETLVKHLPGKSFKKMYKSLYRDRIGKLAKNDIAGNVAARILERIGKDDLADARDKIMLETVGLLQRHRLFVIRSLVERCEVRQIPLDQLVTILKSTLGDSPADILKDLLRPKEPPNDASATKDTKPGSNIELKSEKADVSGSRLAQSMLEAKSTHSLVQDSLIEQTNETLVNMAKDPISSRIIQVALKSQYSDHKFLKQLITKLIGSIEELAVSTAGSHVVDALWDGTKTSHFLKEKIAQELQQSETKLRETHPGRTVWRNWQMDVYQRRPREWHNMARGFQEVDEVKETGKPNKTPLQLARERHAQKQSQVSRQHNNEGSKSVSAHA